MMLNRRGGFTLIELLIVIAVIAILVGIAVPRFQGMRDEANIAKANGELHALQTAVESYYIHQDEYPASTTSLCVTYLNVATPRIIDKALYDPFAPANTEYNYFLSSNGNYYVIASLGPDRVASISGIGDDGKVGAAGDDIYITNGE